MLGVAASLGLDWLPAQADPGVTLPRVDVTGSQLRRTVTESGLPLLTIGRAEIERSGATSLAELLQRLPMVQGQQALAESVGNDGNGITTVSLHNLGAKYTLVLLNGQRMASSDGGSVIDLGTLPMAALERIEILGDGASAVYGADAIGGVVNLILRQGETPLFVNTRLTAPQGPGGGGWQFALGQGLGDLTRDGYALTWVASHDRARTLRAADRSVSASGLIRFRDPSGQDLLFFNGSMRASPANAAVDYTDASGAAQSVYLNPGLQANGQCPRGHLEAGGLCYFDYAATVVDQAQVERASLMASGVLRLGATGFDWRTDALLARSRTRVTVAPYPADVAISTGSKAFTAHVLPWLTDEQRAGLTGATAHYRLSDLGGRMVDYTNDALHLSTGVEGHTGGWQLKSTLTWSAREQRQDYRSGWLLGEPFMAGLADGRIDPFAAPGQQSAAGLAALAGAGMQGRYDTLRSDLFGAELRAATEPFMLPGGPAQWGLGGEWRRTLWRRTLSDVARTGALLFGDVQQGHDVQRDTLGAYTELLLPVTPAFNLTGALRYDHLGAAQDLLHGVRVGNTAGQFTSQLSGRWQVRPGLLWRASAGTGFRAPDLLQLTRTQEDYGVTAGAYACPFTAANGLADHPYAGLCWPGSNQVEAVKGGNAALRPERSRQWSLGGAFEPSRTLSFGADLWSVQVRDAVQDVSERLILAD
ncbi:MAG: TonB-dependent receptor, partial [Sphaerotilus sp.]|nr:TonB-dependent receptor [Sphaerotilus sp.]